MLSPTVVRFDTYFVNQNEKPYVDPISKMFLISEAIFGLNRMPIIGRGQFVYVFLTFMIFLIINTLIVYITVQASEFIPIDVMMVTLISKNIISSLLSYTSCKWMLRYYSELRKFDAVTGCRPKVSNSCIWNLVLATLSCIFTVFVFVIPFQIDGVLRYSPQHLIPIYIVHVTEWYYIGHLLNLLTPRLKLINYYIESSLSSARSQPNPISKEFVFKSSDPNTSQCPMKKLMDLFLIIVDAYDCLIEGIKWQLLITLISAFVTVLGLLYVLSLNAIHSGEILTERAVIYVQLGVTLILMIALFAPCIFSESIHSEVKKLRELLTSRLYENKLDKSGRSIARALLAFTDTHDLSFRLLRMLNIDISMPFKFVGLLVTYLIILLQFVKVINP